MEDSEPLVASVKHAAADDDAAGLLEALPAVLYAVLVATIKTIFALDAASSTNRTAVFLLTFLLIHCAGNLLVFLGADVFNAYGHLLSVNPLLKLIEVYLLLAGIIHAAAGFYITYRKRRFLVKGSAGTVASNSRIFISSVVVLVFVIVHLLQFKYGKYYTYLSQMDVTVLSEGGLERVAKGTAMRDLYKLETEIFSNPLNAWGYILAIVALGAHIFWGWSKAVGKLGLEKRMHRPAETLGHWFFGAIIAGFISQPLYVLYVLV